MGSKSYTIILIPSVLCDSMNHAASYWFFVSNHYYTFPGVGHGSLTSPATPLWLTDKEKTSVSELCRDGVRLVHQLRSSAVHLLVQEPLCGTN